MKVIEKQIDNYTIKYILISHRFGGFENVICSGSLIYQLPCLKSNREYKLRELKPKMHLGMKVYLIDRKRISAKRLKELAIKVNEQFELETKQTAPF